MFVHYDDQKLGDFEPSLQKHTRKLKLQVE